MAGVVASAARAAGRAPDGVHVRARQFSLGTELMIRGLDCENGDSGC
jgi:hypothetical protein